MGQNEERDRSFIAADLGGTKIACGIVTFPADGGTPVVSSVEKVPTPCAEGGAEVLRTLVEAVKAAKERSDVEVEGVGVSTGGVVDPVAGTIVYANEMIPGWTGQAVGPAIEEALGLPCRVQNDVHAHALGEARRGAGRGAASCLVVAVGTGIGGAFVDHDMILLGAHDAAGHVGHVTCTQAAGIPCTCGATSHVESVASGPAIVEEYIRLSGEETQPDGSPVDGAYISRLAEEGDEAARAAEIRSAAALGEVLGSFCDVLDPERIILSGSVALAGPLWHDTLRASMDASSMPLVHGTPVVKGTLGGDAPLIGAAENILSPAYKELS